MSFAFNSSNQINFNVVDCDAVLTSYTSIPFTSEIMIAAPSLQNPTDPYATYRLKGKGHIGYVANVVEEFNDIDRILEY